MNVDRELIDQVRLRLYYSRVTESGRERFWRHVLHGMMRRLTNERR